MARTITIAGTDRTADIKFEEFSIEQVLTSQEDNCTFTVKSGAKPTAGQEIIVTDGGVRLFAGIIDVVQDDPRAPGITFYKCQARDYTYQLDKKLVVETYANQAADLIVKDILTKYCAGFTSTNVKTGAPTVEQIVFDYRRPSECFKELANYVGWDWYVDYNKDVWFFNPSATATPAPVGIASNTDCRNLKHDIETEGLRNRIFVRGGTMLSDPWTYSVNADGVTRAWVLPHKPHNISLTVGGVAKTIGIENIDDEATKDYLMNYQEKYVRASAQTATPVSGTTMSLTYKYDIDVITMVEDVASQNAVKAVQGGDGVYEHIIVDDNLTTIDAAEAAGNADLREHANPRVKGSFETEISGWAPGQLVTINLPDRGISGTYLVQKVTITPATPTLWTYRVEYGGRLLGIADWLQALWKAQQKKKLNETALLHKFHYGAETAKVIDEVQGTLRTPPWKAEKSLEVDLGDKLYSKTETTQADFQAGTLTSVVATSAGDLELSFYQLKSEAETWARTGTWTEGTSAASSGTRVYSGDYTTPAKIDVTVNLPWDGYYKFTLNYEANNDRAKVEFLIDNVSKGVFDQYSASLVTDMNLSLGTFYLTAGNHTLTLRHTGTRNASSTGWYIEADYVLMEGHAPSGSRLSPVYDISPAGIAASGTISWNATLPANTSLTVETNLSLDGGITWQGWQVCTNGGAIPGITEGTDLSKARLQIRQTLSTTDTTVTPQLHDVTVIIRPLVQFATVGSLMVVWQPGSEVWAQPQYRTSTDGITWSAWQAVDPAQCGPIEVPSPGYVRLKANSRIQAKNWKKPFDQTDVVCGFVMAAS